MYGQPVAVFFTRLPGRGPRFWAYWQLVAVLFTRLPGARTPILGIRVAGSGPFRLLAGDWDPDFGHSGS